MRATARTILAVICATGAITAAATSGGSALAASGASTTAIHTTAASRPWLPSTPTYWPQVVGQQATRPQTITSGVQWNTDTYQTVGGAQKAQVLNIDLTNPNLHFGAVEAGDKLIDPSDETISSMATRTGAIAGVNSDFFAINTTGQPNGMLIQNGVLEASPVASWPYDMEVLTSGQIEMATETFSGTVDDTTTGATDPLAALNRIDQNNLTEVTPYLGAVSIGASTIAAGTVANGVLTITSVKTSQTALPALTAGQEDLIARRGTADSTWLQKVHAGDTLTVSDSLAPYGLDQIQTALSGGAYLAQNGAMAVPVTGGGENNVAYPIVGIGVSKDGTHAIEAVFDGRQSENQAVGLTRPQFAQWMLAHGAYNAIEFDSGGSAEMVARLPGQAGVSVLNTPSDGHERDVANGLFLYSTEAAPAAATRAVVNGDKPMAMLAGDAEQVSAYATDAEGNPAATGVQVSVEPSYLATVAGSPTGSGTSASLTLTAGSHPGLGWLVAKAGDHVESRVPFTVTGKPRSLSVSPSEPDISNGGTQQFSVTGTADGGTTLTMTPKDATWTVSPASLGTVSSGGLFTAAATGNGLATITAAAGGASATASVAVGSSATVLDPMTDTGNWSLNTTNGATGSLSESTSQVAQPGDTGSMDVHYSIPAASGVSQVVFSSKNALTVGNSASGQAPTAIGLWIKGIGGTPGTPLANGELTFAEAYTEANGQTDTFYPTTVTYDGWQLIEAQVPQGAQLPMTLNFLDFLVINPSPASTGDLYVADLEALYSPRQSTTPPYTAIPQNPKWLQYVGSPAQFAPGGVTVAAFGDSHLQSADHDTTGSVVTSAIASAIQALPANATPNMVQVVGNLTDAGSLADEQYGQQMMQSFGLPFHNTVGDNDIGNGADPENGNWTSVFGPTHYSYTDGHAEFIDVDSAWEGLLASDPYQVPDEEQYAWLVSQLSASTSKDIFVVTHASPYDPHPIANSQFTDRYEAQMYEQLIDNYQETHPGTHVVLLNSQSRGVAEQVLDPDGTLDRNGLPNFDTADAGVPAYTTVDQGGFYNYALFHILPDGTIQFAFQPVLATIAVTAAQSSLRIGGREQLTATGTTPTGDNLTALQVPIADPASHQWSSSNPRVAEVDPSTGQLLARSPGTATISVLSGGVTGTVTVTVTR
ncbi:MAG TPA: phosphodiester glycosidase family protein [Trebonia sp.]|nr:phosphodiester glycosidase family protein [Trebonia sp.]